MREDAYMPEDGQANFYMMMSESADEQGPFEIGSPGYVQDTSVCNDLPTAAQLADERRAW